MDQRVLAAIRAEYLKQMSKFLDRLRKEGQEGPDRRIVEK